MLMAIHIFNLLNSYINMTNTIVDIFTNQVQKTPEKLAVSYGSNSLTFSKLNDLSNRLAITIGRVLKKYPTKKETIVGISCEGTDAIVGIIAILKAGLAYVPLNIGTLNPGRQVFPQDRLDYMIEDTGIKMVISDPNYVDIFQNKDLEVLTLPNSYASESEIADQPKISPNHLAYALYTSGSSGRPKAVMIEHHSVINLWKALSKELRLPNVPLRVSMNAPLGFDPSIQQLTFMLSGHHLVLISNDLRSDGRTLLNFIRSNAIQVFDCTPAQLRLIVQAGLLDSPNDLIAILCGGEAIDINTWNVFADNPHPRVYNLYGPTECTVDTCIAPFTGSQPIIGWPIRNTKVLILNESDQQVPADTTAEKL